MKRSAKSTKSHGRQRRDNKRFKNLDPSENLKTRQDEINDVNTYFNKLPDGAQEVTLADGTKKVMDVKAWMNKFMGEWNGADLGPDPINKKRKHRKTCTDRNNARNRDIYSREAAKGMLTQVGDLTEVEDQIDVFSKPIEKEKK